MPYKVIRITPHQRTTAQDLKLPQWKQKSPPPEGEFETVYAPFLDTIYTTNSTTYSTLQEKFATSLQFIAGVVYMGPGHGKKSKEKPVTGPDFDSWQLVQRGQKFRT